MENQSPEGKRSMIEIVDPADARAVRNKDNILACYELLINQKKPEEGAKYVDANYIQHNPLLADGPKGLSEFFAKVAAEHDAARVVVHKIIAVGDWVWTHVNFLNLFTDDPHDTGVAAVDIWIMSAEGKCLEHWDILQLVGDPTDAAPWLAPNLLPANTNGMF
jgi:predicted SnoaL-like aldol condensation-catalyzing enzyme